MAMRFTRAFLVTLLIFSFDAAEARAQQATGTPDKLPAALSHLAGESEAYAKAVPSFACTEVIHTRLLHKGREKQHADYETAIRVLRQPDGKLNESFVITLFNGKPPAIGKALQTISYLEGGLSKGVPSFFAAGQRACYRYSLNANRIDFTAEPRDGADCANAPSTAGFGLLDDDGNLLHGEVRRSAEDARKWHNPMLFRLDYAPVRLGEQTYRMPSHLYAETSVDASVGTTFDAQYTACHLYKVTATILPATADAEPK